MDDDAHPDALDLEELIAATLQSAVPSCLADAARTPRVWTARGAWAACSSRYEQLHRREPAEARWGGGNGRQRKIKNDLRVRWCYS